MSSKLESDVCCRLQVAPSGESYEGKRRPGRLLLGIWRDSLHVTCGLTACTPGSAPGPTLGNEYGKTLPFFYFCTDVAVWSYTTVPVAFRLPLLCILTNLEMQERYLPIIGDAETPFRGVPRHFNHWSGRSASASLTIMNRPV